MSILLYESRRTTTEDDDDDDDDNDEDFRVECSANLKPQALFVFGFESASRSQAELSICDS